MERRVPLIGGPLSRRWSLVLGVLVGLLASPSVASGQGGAGEETVYNNDFGGAVGPEWAPQQLTTSPGGERFLGRFGNGSARLRLTALPDHENLSVEFDLYVLDSMDGNDTGPGSGEDEDGIANPDVFTFSADGAQLKRTTFGNRHPQAYPGDFPGASNPPKTGATATDSLGFDEDTTFRVSLSFPHSGNAVSIVAAASGLDDLDDESWGIDNVEVTATPGCDSPFEPGDGGQEIVGTPGNNTLIGTDGNDVICGLGGNDEIFGGGGQDVMLGGAGKDFLDGEAGPDLFLGERGADRLIDPVAGELDTFSGGPGTDLLSYSGSARTGGVIATIGGVGGDGEGDVIRNSIENLRGTRFNDRLTGNGKRNWLIGFLGTDRLRGKRKADRLRGGGGDDILIGNAGPDRLQGGVGSDDLFGDSGRDFFFGGPADDSLFAKDGRVDRRLNGGPGELDSAEYDSAERSKLRSVELR